MASTTVPRRIAAYSWKEDGYVHPAKTSSDRRGVRGVAARGAALRADRGGITHDAAYVWEPRQNHDAIERSRRLLCASHINWAKRTRLRRAFWSPGILIPCALPTLPSSSGDRAPLPDTALLWVPVIPDLVVEVASSGDRPAEIQRKAAMWLDAGVRLVWVVLPTERVIEVHRAGQPVVTLDESATLDGADVVPGFATPVAAIFGLIFTVSIMRICPAAPAAAPSGTAPIGASRGGHRLL